MLFGTDLIFFTVRHWGIIGMAILYFVESMGLPAPIELPLAMSGFLLASGKYDAVSLILITWASTSIGNLIILIASRTKIKGVYIRAISHFVTEETIDEIDRLVHRYGVLVIVFTRWINWFFGLSLWICSLHKISPKKFIAAIVINNLIWSILWVYFGGFVISGITSSKIHWSIIIIIPLSFLLIGYMANILRKKLSNNHSVSR